MARRWMVTVRGNEMVKIEDERWNHEMEIDAIDDVMMREQAGMEAEPG